MNVQFQKVLGDQPYSSCFKIPSTPGVYIYGLLLDVIFNPQMQTERKFVPLAVGETDNLNRRLISEKYYKFKTGGNGNKELFDFSKNLYSVPNLKELYLDMMNYDSLLNARKNKLQNISLMINHGKLKNLVYFQDFDFYNLLLKLSAPKADLDHIEAVNSLTSFSSFDTDMYIKKILETKINFRDKYYFSYATTIDVDSNPLLINKKRKQIEAYTKSALKSIEIYTTERHTSSTTIFQVELSPIQDILINVTGTQFPNPLII